MNVSQIIATQQSVPCRTMRGGTINRPDVTERCWICDRPGTANAGRKESVSSTENNGISISPDNMTSTLLAALVNSPISGEAQRIGLSRIPLMTKVDHWRYGDPEVAHLFYLRT